MAARRWHGYGSDASLGFEIEGLLRKSAIKETGAFDDFGMDTDMPRVDLQDADGHYIMVAELPGVSASDLKVVAGSDALVVEGRWGGAVPTDEGTYVLSETMQGAFRRTVVLPGPARGDEAKAVLENGLLIIVLPKAEKTSEYEVDLDLSSE